jgi:hypothetical protein
MAKRSEVGLHACVKYQRDIAHSRLKVITNKYGQGQRWDHMLVFSTREILLTLG